MDDVLNTDLLHYNQLMMDANAHFQMKDIAETIHCYELALETDEALQSILNNRQQEDPEKQSLIKSNLGVIYFHNCEYKKSMIYLTEAFELIRDRHGDFRQALIIKLLVLNNNLYFKGNLCIVNLINNKYEQSKDYNEQALDVIDNTMDISEKRMLYEELMYVYFRFTSFESMGDGEFDNLEQKYDGATLGCFYSAMGINRELCDDPTLAYRYHRKALEVWSQCRQNGFIVITLRRLITLGQTLQITQMEMREYVTQLQKYMQTDELKGLSADILFKDCEKKIQCAREITVALKNFEENFQQYPTPKVNTEKQGEPLWKMAIRLRLKRAINFTRDIMEERVDKELLQQSINQLTVTVQQLSQPQPSIVEKQLQTQAFTKESINHLKAQMNRIRKYTVKGSCVDFFLYYNKYRRELVLQTQFQKQQSVISSQMNRLNNNNQQQLQQSVVVTNPPPQQQYSNIFIQQPAPTLVQSTRQQPGSNIKPPQYVNGRRVILSRLNAAPINHQVLSAAYRVVLLGDYLVKCNKNTNGRIQRFFKLGQDNTFRWAAKDKYINDPNKIQYYQVSDIRGLVYGKCTDVLNKTYNKNLETWLCFSLVMRTRSMDFVLEPDQVNSWVIALSEEIKRKNRFAFTLTPGRFFWRKLKAILQWFFVTHNPNSKKDKRFKLSFAKTVIALGRNNLRLPKISA